MVGKSANCTEFRAVRPGGRFDFTNGINCRNAELAGLPKTQTFLRIRCRPANIGTSLVQRHKWESGATDKQSTTTEMSGPPFFC